jgi:hypothetical protein
MRITQVKQPQKRGSECGGGSTAFTAPVLSQSPAAAPAGRQTAGFFSIPFKHWHGRLEKLPVVLQQIFMPLLQPNLERLQRGEILRTGVFVPKIGVLEVKWKGDEVWASFVDALAWGQKILQHCRLFALALRYRTFSRSPEGGLWVWLPQQLVFSPDCRSTLSCAEYQVNLLGRSPPLWWQPTDWRLETTDETQSQKRTSRWLTPSVPRAQRAPTCAARLAWRVAG